MTTNIVLDVVDKQGASAGRKHTVTVDRKCVIEPFLSFGGIKATKEEIDKIEEATKRASDTGVLENDDLVPEEKLKMAELNNFSKYYDIKLSDDKKYFQVTIKDAGFFIGNPTLEDIKDDFGTGDNVFVQRGCIPHGNDELIRKRTTTEVDGERISVNYDRVKLEVGDTINVPVDRICITGTPHGFFGRIF